MGRSRDTIKIFLRLRPHRKHEGALGNYEIDKTSFEDAKITFHVDRRNLERDYVNSSREDYAFTFDNVFDQATTQQEIFDAVARDSVMSVIQGYNSTIFAYGQTGSGKTFSITGGTEAYEDRGIIPRAIKLVFDEVKKREETHTTTVHLSYMQIYNNKAMDLLNRGKDARSMDELPAVTVHETEDEIVLKGLEARPANTTHDALNLLFLGDTNRLYSETPMNASSSRSHCIFSVLLESRAHGSAVVTRSKLNLVDLAGSERVGKTGVTGTLLSEAKYINVSLFHLEHVIVALSEHADHIPFRDSIMTMALKDSLGGNCRTSMLAAGHPADVHLPETISTCRFAQRVASIRQKAVLNQETDPVVVIRQLKREIAGLKDQVAFLSNGKDTDPSRALSGDEQSRCREAVQRFLSDPDAGSELSGLGGDLARIRYCFQHLKEIASNKRPASSASSSAPVAAAAPLPPLGGSVAAGSAAGGGGGLGNDERQALLEQIRRLQTSVQQKENELALLFGVMESGGPLRAAGTPPAAAAPLAALAGGPRDVRPPSNGGASATPTNAQAPGQLSLSSSANQSVMSRIRGVAQAANGPLMDAAGPSAPAMSLAVQEQYDLEKLSDPALLKDRQAAFEAFRKSYRRYEQIEKSQSELRERISAAKQLAVGINGIIDQMKALKAHIQQLRAERALMGGGEADQEGPEEAAAKRKLDEELRPAYRKATEGLSAEKERIDHLKHMMHRSQEQVIKDFEAWFKTRQAQVAAVMRQQQQQPSSSQGGSGAAGASSSSSLGRAESGSTFTQQQHLLQRLDMQRHEARMEAELNPAPGAAAASAPGSAQGGIGGSRLAGSMRSSSSTGMVPTGNADADAELARLFKARDELSVKLQQQQQPSLQR